MSRAENMFGFLNLVDTRFGGTEQLLADSGVVCPPFEAYADVLVGWVADYERSLRNEPDHLAGA